MRVVAFEKQIKTLFVFLNWNVTYQDINYINQYTHRVTNKQKIVQNNIHVCMLALLEKEGNRDDNYWNTRLSLKTKFKTEQYNLYFKPTWCVCIKLYLSIPMEITSLHLFK